MRGWGNDGGSNAGGKEVGWGRHSSNCHLHIKGEDDPGRFSLEEAQALAETIRKRVPGIDDPCVLLPPVFNMDYWFATETQRQLAAILACIREEPNSDRRDFLKLAFSSVVRPVSRAGNMEVHLHVKVGKVIPNAVKLFEARLLDMVTRERHFRRDLPVSPPEVCIYTQDSRQLGATVGDNSIDFIFTSPPYGTGSKYASIYRLQIELLQLSRPKRPLEVSKDFASELTKCFVEMHRILRPGRKLAILYGTNRQFSAADVVNMATVAGFGFERSILCPVIDESKMVRGDYRRRVANEHLIIMTKPV